MKKQFYSLDEIAQILQVSYMTVYRWVRAGKLKAYQVEKQYRVNSKDLSVFIERGEKVNLTPISNSLSRFIGSGMMDYSYIESREFPVNLSLGINPLGHSPLVTNAFKDLDLNLSAYSQVVAVDLRKKLGETYGFRSDEVLIGAGVSELIHVCFLTFLNPNDVVLLPEVSFPAFEFLAYLTHGVPRFIDSNSSFDLDYHELSNTVSPRTKLVILCNPNNPTGMKLDTSKVERIIKNNKSTVFIIDEANIDFGGDSLLHLTKKYQNLLVLRSFSKGFGLAGLRVGMVFGSKDLIYAIQRRQTPFMVNAVGQKLAEVALDDLGFLKKSKKYVQTERKFLEKELKLLGYEFVHSDANYLLVNIGKKFKNSRDFIRQINKHQANAVDGDDFRGLGGKYIRLSPRLHHENEKFIEVLKTL